MRASFAVVIVAAAASACVSYALPPEDAAPDAGGGGAAVTITTLAAPTTSSPGGKLSAAWAAFQIDDGPWQAVAPKSEGVYELGAKGARWAVAFACDDQDFETSTIAIHRRPASVTSLEVTLPDPCRIQPPAAFLVAGTLSNLPTATSWLEFGYPLESRGSVLPVNGTAATYELVNVVDGTWDIAFAVRDTPAGPLTRATIVRARPIRADVTLDLDLGGAPSFVPGLRSFVLRGVGDGEQVTPLVWFTTGGPTGLSLGPQDVPTTTSAPSMQYATIPSELQLAGDRYRIDAGARMRDGDRQDGVARAILGSFQQPLDLDLTLPEPIAAPTAQVVATDPYIRVATTYVPRAGTSAYVVEVAASVTRKSVRRFVMNVTAEVASPTETMPDLSALAGFRPEWGLPRATTLVKVTAIEPDAPLGDGTMHRESSNALLFDDGI